MDRTPPNDDRLPGTQPEVIPVAHATSTAPRFTLSLPGAIAGALLVTAIALGTAALCPAASPAGDRGAGDQAANDSTSTAADSAADSAEALGHYAGGDAPDGRDEPAVDQESSETTHEEEPVASAQPKESAEPETGLEPEPDATLETDPQPDATAETEPTPPAEPEALDLTLAHADGKVRIDWSACDPAGFRMYKVLRSPDATITWPRTKNDTYVAAVEDMTKTHAADANAPAGKKVHYRVFALDYDDGEYHVLCQTPVRAIETPAPEPPPAPQPAQAALELILSLKEGHPYVDWTRYEGDGFDYYKVVRSKDSSVGWPLGENDALVGAFEDPAKTAMLDGEAHGATTYWYRVFAVRRTETGYKVLASSAARKIATPESKPAPDPYTMGFEVVVEGQIVLHWEACASDGFHYYKVVRSAGENPSYLPSTDGTEIIGVIEDSATTTLADMQVESGQTWFYRVQSIGVLDGQKVLLGQTPVREVHVP